MGPPETSADQTRASALRPSERGMSFAEVMVTIFILALATSFIIMTIPPAARTPQDIARLETALERASARARIGGTPTGLAVIDNGYVIADWRGGRWQSIPGSLTPLGTNVTLAAAPGTRSDDRVPDDWPIIVFDPLGHTPPAAIELRVGREIHRIATMQDGTVNRDDRLG